MGTDKLLFRQAARSHGVPTELVSASKSPMQVSSGILGSLNSAVRDRLAENPRQRAYTDPREGSLDFTVARLRLSR